MFFDDEHSFEKSVDESLSELSALRTVTVVSSYETSFAVNVQAKKAQHKETAKIIFADAKNFFFIIVPLFHNDFPQKSILFSGGKSNYKSGF